MYIFWAILGIIFLYLDLLKKSTIKLTLASTFLFCAIIAYKFPQNHFYQAICLLCFGGIFYTMISISFTKEAENKNKEEKLGDFIGKKAIVTKDIGKTLSIDGIGYIRYKKELWQAKSVDDKEIKSGTKVEIVSKENKIMNVRVIK
ncbi:NfeD family protein [bacterium]|nr:NfeD family protein [bacterium]MBQ9150053.1 NfeD family protein [bacterium]